MTTSESTERPGGYETSLIESDAAAGTPATSTFDPPRGRQRAQPTKPNNALGPLDGGAPPVRGRWTPDWSIYTIAELVKFRDEINKQLPPLELGKFNLEEEVMLQFHVLRAMQGNVIDDQEVPVNQRAQVANTVAATLKTLGDQQIALYNSERFKEIENALIRELDKLPEDLAASFIDNYDLILRKYR